MSRISDSEDDEYQFEYNVPKKAQSTQILRSPVEHDEGNTSQANSRSANYPVSLQKALLFYECLSNGPHSSEIIKPKLYQNYLRKLQKCMGRVVYGDSDLISIIAEYWEDVATGNKAVSNRGVKYEMAVDSEGVILNRSIIISKAQSYCFPHNYERLTYALKKSFLDSSSSIRSVGAGQFGRVFQAYDCISQQKFAEKIVKNEKFSRNELEILSSIEHEHIVKCYGVIRTPCGIHILMQFGAGGSIDQLLQDGKGFVGENGCDENFYAEYWAIYYYEQVMSAIVYLQNKKIVHCDIKASNVVLSSDRRNCFLTDFGEARRIMKEGCVRLNNRPVGTENYISPEVIQDQIYYFASDVWSSACFLLNMLTAKPPWMLLYPNIATYLYVITKKPYAIVQEIPQWVTSLTRSILQSSFQDHLDRKSAEELLNLASKNASILRKYKSEKCLDKGKIKNWEKKSMVDSTAFLQKESDYSLTETVQVSYCTSSFNGLVSEAVVEISQTQLSHQCAEVVDGRKDDNDVEELAHILEQYDIDEQTCVDNLHAHEELNQLLNELSINSET